MTAHRLSLPTLPLSEEEGACRCLADWLQWYLLISFISSIFSMYLKYTLWLSLSPLISPCISFAYASALASCLWLYLHQLTRSNDMLPHFASLYLKKFPHLSLANHLSSSPSLLGAEAYKATPWSQARLRPEAVSPRPCRHHHAASA